MLYLVTIIVTWILMPSPVYSAAPVFTKPDTGDRETSCFENIAASTSVYRVDVSNKTGVTVTIKNQTPPSPPFDLTYGPFGWDLKTPASEVIDRETAAEFTFVFSATDGTSTVQSVTLTLILTDRNDNSPRFTESVYTKTIYDTETAGVVLLTIVATDADASPTITYSITVGNTDNAFSIVATTGHLKLTTPGNLNPATTPTYTLTVQASDEGANVNTTAVTINVVADPCYPLPCLNNGTCKRNDTNYTCICPTGWLGDKCESADPCQPSPCLNGGMCQRNDTNYTCGCPPGLIGDKCELDDPCIPNPCENGGTCMLSLITYECMCTSGYQGPNCSTTVTTTVMSTTAKEESSDNTVTIIIIVCVTVASVIIIGIVIYKKQDCKTNRVKDKCSQSETVNHDKYQTVETAKSVTELEKSIIESITHTADTETEKSATELERSIIESITQTADTD